MRKTKIKAEKRDEKNKPKMRVSGKSVFKLQEIIAKRAKSIGKKKTESLFKI